jgi:hypothetical protein
MAHRLDNLYKDVPIYVISTGTSLRGFDFGRLNGRVTLGVNRVIEHYRPAIMHFVDTTAHQTHARALRDYNGMIIAGVGALPTDTHDNTFVVGPPDAKPPRRVETREGVANALELNKQKVGRTFGEDLFGSGAGCTALHVAILLGGNPIYLLGYDYYEENGAHFDEYDESRNGDEVYTYSREGVERISREEWVPAIYNCNPKSRLKCFPHADLETLLAGRP